MNKIVLSIVIGGAMVASQAVLANPNPTLVDASYHTGYIPDGFDTNDKVQVVGEGRFNNSCYRPALYNVSVNHETKTVKVKPKAFYYSGMCLQVLVPFSQTINVGLLKTGTYDVVQGDEEKDIGELKVRAATNSTPDDFTYAPVQQAFLDTNEEGTFIRVTGEFTNSCMKFEDLQIQVQPKVLVVRPITEMEERSDCEEGQFPFDEHARVVQPINPGRYLLHIRSMNGKAVNNLVNIY